MRPGPAQAQNRVQEGRRVPEGDEADPKHRVAAETRGLLRSGRNQHTVVGSAREGADAGGHALIARRKSPDAG